MSSSHRCFCVLCYATAAIVAASIALASDRFDASDSAFQPLVGNTFQSVG